MDRGTDGARRPLAGWVGRGSPGTRPRAAGALLASVACAAAFGASADGAAAEEATAISFSGGPLTVSVGSQGQCQSSYVSTGNNFFPPGGALGDCGFFLAFPTEGNPTGLKGTTWGYSSLPPSAGPSLSTAENGYEYTSVEPQSAVTGSGTEADPYRQITRFAVMDSEAHEVLITETTTYVNGTPQFTSTYDVENKSSVTVFFRAMYVGDLYVNTSDFGTGIFGAVPPRFIGGQSTSSGVLGGFIEVSPEWTSWEEGCWNDTTLESEGGRCTGAVATDPGIWHTVRTSVDSPEAFKKQLEPAEVDNAAGVEWDQYYKSGLPADKKVAFTIINRAQVPNGLSVSPATETLTQGQTATITVTATDTASTPYAGKALRYTIAGSNPQSGSVTTNAQGVAQISYVGHNAGQDTVQMYLDLGGSGSQTPADPIGTATVTWTPPPPTPNSSYTVQSIKANADGTITIVFVPTQNGTATVTVTVPTGTIAKKHKPKKCRKGTVRIKGKCRPKTTVTGTVQAKGTAGAPLTITVAPSASVRAALRKGKTVPVTATLSYQSELGGAPVVQIYHVTLKPKKPTHHKKHHKKKK